MKTLIFDSSSIISLALNNLLFMLPELKKLFSGRFVITEEVQKEVVDTPIHNKKFELGALMISKLIKEGIFEIVPVARNKTAEVMETSNTTFYADEPVRIIQEGEASVIALYKELAGKERKTAMVIDERTARMLCEKPENLHKLLRSKLHRKITAKRKNYSFFSGLRIIRSSELALIAYMSRLISLPSGRKKAIEAILYGLKFNGCAISRQEIEAAKQL